MRLSKYALAAALAVGFALPAAAQYPTGYVVPATGYYQVAPAPTITLPSPAAAGAYQATYGFTHPHVKEAVAEMAQATYGVAPAYGQPAYYGGTPGYVYGTAAPYGTGTYAQPLPGYGGMGRPAVAGSRVRVRR